ncbi:MAG: phosphatase PAP2 family protein [Phycisphaeraceae bacterium]|nr:phosphatase PAP2 family protein [Phycisphaeraceae bacterium]
MARVLYGALFVVAIPLLLVVLAQRLDAIVQLPALCSPLAGGSLIAAGVTLMAWSMLVLWRLGGGLPMNAFPPPRFMRRGPYRALDHPIYLGFVMATAGVAIASSSAAGFWIITPLASLGCIAIVMGYEAADLDRRFGRNREPSLWALPPDSAGPPRPRHRAAVFFRLYLPWLVLYEWIGHLPVPDGIDVRLGPERHWPVFEWAEWPYASVYLAAIVAPFVAPSSAALRRFMVTGWWGTALGMTAYLVVPFIAPPRDFEPSSVAGHLLMWERADGLDGRAAFPSFHVFWTLLTAALLASRWPRLLVGAWATIAVIACVMTGMHAVVDLVAGALLFFVSWRIDRVWSLLRRSVERLANSWRAWQVGPVRIINHGVFAGVAAAVGVLITGTLVAGGDLAWIAALMIASLVGAAIWGQMVVGRPTSLRPFGYFGSVVGVGSVALVAWATGVEIGTLAAAAAVAAPWVQLIGRKRCLVQGCCHGAPVPSDRAWLGIRCVNEQSRVVRLSSLRAVPIHATPFYSMVANALLGAMLLRLALLRAPIVIIIGAYFVLAGMSRFVEEAFRGEPHTPVIGGLRLYQWLSIGMVLIGAMVMMLPADGAPWPTPRLTAGVVAVALVAFVLHAFAMGVDFPASSRRFSRLA